MKRKYTDSTNYAAWLLWMRHIPVFGLMLVTQKYIWKGQRRKEREKDKKLVSHKSEKVTAYTPWQSIASVD